MISYSPPKMVYKHGQEAGAIFQLETQVSSCHLESSVVLHMAMP